MAKKILITGHNGYLGSVMVPIMLNAGYDVTGLDTCYYERCTLVPDNAQIPALRKDIREIRSDDLVGYEAVIHLAALSNDPIGNLNSRWTREINLDGSVKLGRLAKQAGVQRFLFSSSCIMYGMSETQVVDEQSPLDPRTEYARSKVSAERGLAELADERFAPVFLRNGTLYGLSPRMRFDTVYNDLIANAVACGRVVVHGDGTPWRPVIHAECFDGYQLVPVDFRTRVAGAEHDRHVRTVNVGVHQTDFRAVERERNR